MKKKKLNPQSSNAKQQTRFWQCCSFWTLNTSLRLLNVKWQWKTSEDFQSEY